MKTIYSVQYIGATGNNSAEIANFDNESDARIAFAEAVNKEGEPVDVSGYTDADHDWSHLASIELIQVIINDDNEVEDIITLCETSNYYRVW